MVYYAIITKKYGDKMSNLERIVYIDDKIRETGGIRIADIITRFEISERQAKRDLEYLRYRIDAPLVWDGNHRHYTYQGEWPGLGFMDEKAFLFYVFARAAAGTLAYVPAAPGHSSASLIAPVPERLRRLAGAVRYELPHYEPVDHSRLALLLAAIRDSDAIAASYRDIEDRDSQRTIVPRRIVNYAGTWYCVAWDGGRGELRTFRLSRFTTLTRSGMATDIGPPEAAVDHFLDASYGMFKGSGGKTARVRFFGRALAIVRDERWHPEQHVTRGQHPTLGDFLRLELPVSHWDEILGRILRFGSSCEVEGPEEFRQLWLDEIGRMAALARTVTERTSETLHE
jgi:predicted DNA-binding transcriptional regulator YafY